MGQLKQELQPQPERPSPFNDPNPVRESSPASVIEETSSAREISRGMGQKRET